MRNSFNKLKPCFGTTYIRHINGLYLGMKDNTLCLSNERFLWRIESFQEDKFYLKDIDGYYHAEYWWGNIQTAVDSGYTEQHWYLYKKDNLVLFEHVDSSKFLHYSNDNKLLICEENDNKEGFYFIFEEESFTDGYPYIEILSDASKIALRIEPIVLNFANKEWLKNWINDIERAFYSLARLVGFEPFNKIEIRGYTNCNTWGYIYYGKPIIHINKDCLKKEIIRMRQRKDRGISFGTLHELSHLFDKHYWTFEGEATANMKIAYVLNELGFKVCLSSHSNEESFTYSNYVEALYNEHGRLDNVKSLFCSSLAAKFGEIARVIGWDAFKETFRNYPTIENTSKVERFNMFIDKLSEYSNQDVRAMFNEKEMSTVIDTLSKIK